MNSPAADLLHECEAEPCRGRIITLLLHVGRLLSEKNDIAAALDSLVRDATVVLDCSDNYATRQAVNAACVRHNKPLVAGAVIQFDGQITVVDPRDARSPCYACIFPPDAEFEEVRCSTMGVFAPLVGVVGAMQAAEALKLIAEVGQSLAGRLLMLDGRAMEWNTMRVQRHADCPVCVAR